MTASSSRTRKPRSRRARMDPAGSPLGNDPFARGAAVRAPAVLTPVPSSSPAAPAASETTTAAPASSAASVSSPPPVEVPPGAVAATAAPVVSAAATLDPVALASVRAKLAALESRVESAAASAAARLADLARQEISGEQARDLRRAVMALLPAIAHRVSAVAGLGALFVTPADVDAFGFDRELADRLGPVIEFLYSSWWRVHVRDIESVPASGPVVLVANHGGVLPWDALVLRTALHRDHPAHRDLRPLLDEHALRRRVSGSIARRLGAVAATPDHALQLLERGGAVAVFPEGSRGATRPWPDRYRIQQFGRGGFTKIALRVGAPIVPCAIVGSEETGLPMARAGWLSAALGMPFLNARAPFPLLPLGMLPLPARWSVRFGVPIDTSADGPAAAADPSRVIELTERARASIQRMLDEDVAARRSIYL